MKKSYIGGARKYGMTTMMRFSYVMLTACLFIIILTADAYALRLNEIEANPEGEDSGNEWVELYSEDNVNLDGYSLDHNSSGGPVNLSGTFQGFFVITFPSQWLRNTNEVVYLKLNGEVVDTAGPFSDNKREKTYSFCNGTWLFASSTQNAENSCSSGSGGSGGTQTQTGNSNNNNQNSNNSNLNPNNINEEEDNNIVVNDESNLSNKNNIVLTSYEGNQKPKKITLNYDNNGEVTRTYKTRIGVIYFFIGLCVLLVVLIALRKL